MHKGVWGIPSENLNGGESEMGSESMFYTRYGATMVAGATARDRKKEGDSIRTLLAGSVGWLEWNLIFYKFST